MRDSTVILFGWSKYCEFIIDNALYEYKILFHISYIDPYILQTNLNSISRSQTNLQINLHEILLPSETSKQK